MASYFLCQCYPYFLIQVDGAVKELLALKADYKAATGTDWKPPKVSKEAKKEASPAAAAPAAPKTAKQLEKEAQKAAEKAAKLEKLAAKKAKEAAAKQNPEKKEEKESKKPEKEKEGQQEEEEQAEEANLEATKEEGDHVTKEEEEAVEEEALEGLRKAGYSAKEIAQVVESVKVGGPKPEVAKEDVEEVEDTDEKEAEEYIKEEEKKEDGKPKESKKPKFETTGPDLDTGDSQVGLPLLDGLMALNELQSFSFDLGDKTPQEDHKVASTEVDREAKEKEAALLEEGNIGKANVEKTEKEAAGDIEESKNQAVERELGASNSIQLADLGAGGEIKKVLWPQWAWPPKGNFAESAGNWRASQPKGPRGWMSDSDGSDEEEEAEGYFNMNILKNLAEEAEQFTAPCSSQVQVASPKSRVDNEGRQVKRKIGSQGLPGSSAKRGSGAKKEGEVKGELAMATSVKDSTTSAGIFSSFSEAAAWLFHPGELAAEQREGGLLYDPARPHQISVIQRPGWTSEAAVPNRVSVIRQTGCANKEVVIVEDDEDIIFVEEVKPQPPRPASV